MAKFVTIGRIKEGTLFRLRDSEKSRIFVRGAYYPSSRKCEYHPLDDIKDFYFVDRNRAVYVLRCADRK